MMKNKQILVLFLLGAVLTVLGAIFKILRLPLASLAIVAGMTFEAASGILLVYKLSRKEAEKYGFLDR